MAQRARHETRGNDMKDYLELLRRIRREGSWQENRTGIRTQAISGASLAFDLSTGFPAVTTRRLPFKTFMGELCGFLRAADSAAEFRALNCKVWDANANENAAWLANPYRGEGPDHLGRIYGVQWRHWRGYKLLEAGSAQYDDALRQGWTPIGTADDGRRMLFRSIDQLRDCLDKIMHRPTDRRILFHAWNPAELDEMALPPCHLLYQFNVNVERRELALCLYQRSVDAPLGLVGNLAEAAALVSLFARLTGYTAKRLSWFGSDVHIYENQLEMVSEQLSREPYPAPRLVISDRVPAYAETRIYAPEWLDLVEPADFALENYQHHPPLTAPMAV
jgi:thymidylate synthase